MKEIPRHRNRGMEHLSVQKVKAVTFFNDVTYQKLAIGSMRDRLEFKQSSSVE
jgi:hypothetical protein